MQTDKAHWADIASRLLESTQMQIHLRSDSKLKISLTVFYKAQVAHKSVLKPLSVSEINL